MARIAATAIAAAAFFVRVSLGVDNGLARTPQMGWNNWNAFACDVSEELILGAADKLVSLGFRDLGYTYVLLDDCWSAGRSENGSLQHNTTRFPNGMADVADQIHSRGMRFGMYSDAGSLTCGKYAGSLGHEDVDAKTFASWGVDYLKYDNCFNEGQSGTPLITYNRYKKMSVALNSTGRPILYSMCNWGEDYPWKWAETVANSWRISGDIGDSFQRPDARCPCGPDEGYNCDLAGFHCSAMNILGKVTSFVDKGIPGAWNDLDMLEVGNGGMTDSEYVVHFSMWAAVKSPLIMGNDIRSLSPSSFSILANPAVIAISQDPLSTSAVRRWRYPVEDVDEYGQGDIQLWSGQLAYGDYVVALLNTGNNARIMNATLVDIFRDEGPGGKPNSAQAWDVYDLWADRMSDDTANLILNSNGTALQNGTVSLPYNATKLSYADGLAKNTTALLGKYTTTIQPQGTLKANVTGHGIGFYRLRPHLGSQKRDEL
ncbi:glycoside hydrolase family 27 protein [Xylona heveae TC161]|uniref:Alpha-galactosidase n=1 Tax=Xylona heveae (strain CBS 132557 / TC161) TaxID=1328760 RepID=A0A165IUT4_XYLHT|nr:glycoside hydrolase family 27 protein [Xylona heveae TC161]KZF25420.1 glycoside hydrolase family 27 protein [Xylona heveae TC161]